METIIKSILETAVYAPSGDNSQPWNFRIIEDSVEIFNIPKQDNEIFNFEQKGSYIAHGALIENISILANNHNLDIKIVLFPDKSKPNLVAKIQFIKQSGLSPNPLAAVIKHRSTNRKKYSTDNLTAEQKIIFENIFTKNGGGKLLLVEDQKNMQQLATAASSAERIMLEYKPLHDIFFNLLVWTDENKIGMNVKTLELKPPQKLIFQLFQFWPIARLFSFLKLPAIIAKENAKCYSQCGAIAGILMQDNSKETFIQTGRLLQNLWLTATSLNLSIQPITGIIYLEQSLRFGRLPGLKPELQKLANQAKITINEIFKSEEDNLVFIFRIGKTIQGPSARSIKLTPKIIN